MAEHGNSKFKQEYIEQARKLCLMGATDAKLADFFEVNIDTIYEWKNRIPEFSDTIKGAKDIHDSDLVEKSLLQRALGYEVIEVKKETEGVDAILSKTITTTKQVPAEVAAMIFWLKNRNPNRWRDKQNIEHSGSIENMTDDEIDGRLKVLLDANKLTN